MTELIQKLFSQEAHDAQGVYLLTLYVDTFDETRSDVETSVKSFLKDGFEKNKTLEKEHDVRKKLWEGIFQKLKNKEYFKRGLGIFARFSVEEEILDLEVVDLHVSPETDVYVGKDYNLDQLFWINNLTKNSIVLNLQFNHAEIYTLQGEDLTLKENLEYDLEKDFKEYKQKFSPTKGSEIYHGTGESNKERQNFEFLKLFFSDVVDILKKYESKLSDVEYIIVFRSSFFDVISDYMQKQITKVFSLVPVVLTKRIEDESSLQKESKKALHDAQVASQEKLLENSKENYDLLAQGWDEVCEASKLGRIENLFFVMNVKKEGYIGSDGFVYTSAVENSKKVENILPRLIKQTLEHGGNIYVFKDNEELTEKGVIAGLRF